MFVETGKVSDKTEQGKRRLGQARISLAGELLLGSWGNPCSLPRFCPSHLPVLHLELGMKEVTCVRECSGRSHLPYRDVCSSRCT